jgi:hypothetical protein
MSDDEQEVDDPREPGGQSRREGEGPGYRVPAHIVRQIRRMAREGRSVSEIARAAGVCRITVRGCLKVDG